MVLILGAAVIAAAVLGFMYSKPRGQKLAPYVGTVFEPYVVVAMVVGLCLGIIVVISGVIELAK
jgi:hypothetical protein